jgi:hypothetical protein
MMKIWSIGLIIFALLSCKSVKPTTEQNISKSAVGYEEYTKISNTDSTYTLYIKEHQPGLLLELKVVDANNSTEIFSSVNEYNDAFWISTDKILLRKNLGIEIKQKDNQLPEKNLSYSDYIFEVKTLKFYPKSNL